MAIPVPLPVGSDGYLTAAVDGIGGVIKVRPEDFLVEELPLYTPSGEGEHLMLFIEKRNQTTSDVVRRLAQMFNVRRGHVGYAGLKDKQAVTRQHFTVQQSDSEKREKGIARFEFTPFKLLWAEPHLNKLRPGHLAGNRFVIRIREVEATAVLGAHRALSQLEREGVPNFFGQQRFGHRRTNHLIGRSILRGEPDEAMAWMLGRPRELDSDPMREARERFDRGDFAAALELWPNYLRHDRQSLDGLRQGRSAAEVVEAMDSQARDFMFSALQAAIFNHVLSRRLRDGLLDRLLPGDVAGFDGSRSVFAVDEPTAELENGPEGRMSSLEISPTGPMWGPQMLRAGESVGLWELESLEAFGLTEEHLETCPYSPKGTRRPLRIRMRNADLSGGADEHGQFVRLAFDLPRGSFATMVLREIMKSERDLEAEDDAQ
ncbi:MAG: tRNA pseudouridine(13) synthase TruD [Phycisphaeraceae bacterium]|nr:tRNA pseudouridine(13) synthase TruD [Phycisphaeraceae bacterium]